MDYHYSLFTNVLLKTLQSKNGEELGEQVPKFGKMKLVPFFDAPVFKLHGDMPQKDELLYLKLLEKYNIKW